MGSLLAIAVSKSSVYHLLPNTPEDHPTEHLLTKIPGLGQIRFCSVLYKSEQSANRLYPKTLHFIEEPIKTKNKNMSKIMRERKQMSY